MTTLERALARLNHMTWSLDGILHSEMTGEELFVPLADAGTVLTEALATQESAPAVATPAWHGELCRAVTKWAVGVRAERKLYDTAPAREVPPVDDARELDVGGDRRELEAVISHALTLEEDKVRARHFLRYISALDAARAERATSEASFRLTIALVREERDKAEAEIARLRAERGRLLDVFRRVCDEFENYVDSDSDAGIWLVSQRAAAETQAPKEVAK
ncbi:MAG TPA: hypothetical protein VM537_01970 [Anaerolineae bacterium]|nr:hypothetical protein [Anaerolineae bacterium]